MEFDERVRLCPDGKYRWVYEFHMLKNPVIIWVVFKIFFWILFGILLMVTLMDGSRDGFLESFLKNGKWMLLLMGVFAVLIVVAYLMVAAMYNWKYIVCFELDENGVIHRQLKSQVKKAKAMGWLVVMAGLAKGNLTTMGVGLNSMSKTTSASDFLMVRSVKPLRRWNTIKVNEPFCKNQVYVHPDDFDFVYRFILDHCPKVRK